MGPRGQAINERRVALIPPAPLVWRGGALATGRCRQKRVHQQCGGRVAWAGRRLRAGSGRGRCFHRFLIRLIGGKRVQLDAAVAQAALGKGVGGDGAHPGLACGDEAFGGDSARDQGIAEGVGAFERQDEQLGHFAAVVRVALDAQALDFAAELDRIYRITEGVMRSLIIAK